MTTLHLIRHGANEMLVEHRLAGRAPGTCLNAEGRAQAAALAEAMRDVPLKAVLASPLERAQETAAILAASQGLTVETREGLTELDFGPWTGLPHAELDGDPVWDRFNAFRAGTSVPNGETLADARARMLRVALETRARYPESHVALVGHGDPLRALLMQLLGMPDESVHRLSLEPCGRIVLELGDWNAKLVSLSHSPVV